MCFVITIDGPAGAGKSSVARRLAKHLGIRYLDTGAIYRAVAYRLDGEGISPSFGEEKKMAEFLASLEIRLEKEGIFVNGENVTGSIRSARIDRIVSGYAASKVVRGALLDLQRAQAEYGDLIADGRDTGSVVFPGADMKFFLTASPQARAERRYKELLRKGEAVAYKEVLAQIHERDNADSRRELAPLLEPQGSVHVDTSLMDEDEVVNQLLFLIKRRMAQELD
ncbi:MAG: (d)CMP kinase [Synergistaceae bacterium]|nr:(d)CMP kinase [Synergistaceae bacterium]